VIVYQDLLLSRRNSSSSPTKCFYSFFKSYDDLGFMGGQTHKF